VVEPTERPPTASVLERWRAGRHLSKQRLADLADVSATYVRLIEAGQDDNGRSVVPSAGVIQKLARGLARAEPDESARADVERHAYADLMSAAGYLAPLAPAPAPAAAPAPDLTPLPPLPLGEGGVHAPRSPADHSGLQPAPPAPGLQSRDVSAPSSPLPPGGRGEGGGRTVLLRDTHLHRHLLPLLEGWERLDPRDQSLLLDLFELIAERRTRGADRD
jgi:transcriptional regulator with XRE-family HTH domain